MMMPVETRHSLNQSNAMSSRDIAKMIGISHGEVKRLIKSLETTQRLSQPLSVNLYERQGETREEYLLNKRDSLQAIARLAPAFIAQALDYWQEREQRAHLPDFTNPAVAARAWAEEFERRQAAEQQLALTAPKADFFDRYMQVDDSLGFRQLCKMLKVKEPEFRQFLFERNIMYRANGALMPQQHHLQAGYFTVHASVGENQHAFSQARFTAKGVKWIAGLWAGHLATQRRGAAA